MIDYRLLTFMDLHETMNYTKTAQNLHITQPAVTQHIQYLERKYHVTLFHYEKKQLELTKEGEYLYQHALPLLYNADKLLHELHHIGDDQETIRMGASMAIGESLAPQLLSALYKRNPNLDLHLTLDHTAKLLDDVRAGSVDFALIGGLFDKAEFYTRRLRREELLLCLSVDHPLLQRKTIRIEDLLGEHVFVQATGSGTRDVLIQALAQHNRSLKCFRVTCIDSIPIIKKLVAGGLGISFLYESVLTEELAAHKLATHKIKGFKLMREFHMIAPKHSIFHHQFDGYYTFFKQQLG